MNKNKTEEQRQKKREGEREYILSTLSGKSAVSKLGQFYCWCLAAENRVTPHISIQDWTHYNSDSFLAFYMSACTL